MTDFYVDCATCPLLVHDDICYGSECALGYTVKYVCTDDQDSQSYSKYRHLSLDCGLIEIATIDGIIKPKTSSVSPIDGEWDDKTQKP